MAEFLDVLRDLDFIVAADAAVHAPPRWQRLGRALFSRPAWACYLALVAATVAVCVTDPRFVPVRGHVFFTHYLLVVELTLFVIQPALMMVHELFHLLAGRRLGLHATIRISRRLYFVGFETVLDGLVVVPRRRRYLPMLAGMLADGLLLCLLTVVAWLLTDPGGDPPLAARLCLAVAFTTIPRISWQFYFFLRTDVYHLIVTVLGCHDLHTTARQLVRNRLWTVLGRPEKLVDPAGWHPRDVAVARWYAPAYLLGYTVMIATMVLITVPVAWRFFSAATRTVLDAGTPPGRFWDAALLLALTLFQLGLAGFLALRDRLRKEAS